jgi:iron uptake system EfeUOB component EfeO/EfeM
MDMSQRRQSVLIATSLTGLGLLAGCSGGHSAAGAVPSTSALTITVSANQCAAGWKHASAGRQTFQIHSSAPGAVEVSLINPETGGIYTEVEGIGPGTTRSMPVDLASGPYAFQCDSSAGPPLTGPTVVIPGHVTGLRAVPPADIAATTTAVSGERAYIKKGLAAVAEQASKLAADIRAGDVPAARSAWLVAHLSWEQLGSAYGMFGDYDDEIDGSPFGQPKGVNDPGWTGFYRLEYGLWHGQSSAQLAGPAAQLVHDVNQLQVSYQGMATFPQSELSDLALRTHEILEHGIRFQLSGTDDFGSGTTLAALDANIKAVREQLSLLHPILQSRYPSLPSVYTSLNRFQTLVDAEHAGRAWTPVSKLSAARRAQLNAAGAETVQLLAPVATMLEVSPLP